jgi:hypothetical protein
VLGGPEQRYTHVDGILGGGGNTTKEKKLRHLFQCRAQGKKELAAGTSRCDKGINTVSAGHNV